jgi:hypothetical protein
VLISLVAPPRRQNRGQRRRDPQDGPAKNSDAKAADNPATTPRLTSSYHDLKTLEDLSLQYRQLANELLLCKNDFYKRSGFKYKFVTNASNNLVIVKNINNTKGINAEVFDATRHLIVSPNDNALLTLRSEAHYILKLFPEQQKVMTDLAAFKNGLIEIVPALEEQCLAFDSALSGLFSKLELTHATSNAASVLNLQIQTISSKLAQTKKLIAEINKFKNLPSLRP